MQVTRKDTPTIMDGLVVRYYFGTQGFEINASRNGVSTNDGLLVIRKEETLEEVIKYFRRAFAQHKNLEKFDEALTEEQLSHLFGER